MRSEETQTLCAGCSKAEPKIPQQTSVRTAQDGQNLISWRRSLSSPTNPVWWRSMHTISSYRGNRPTHTDRQDHLQYTAPQLACSVVRERERQTERDWDRDRHTDRQRNRQRDRETDIVTCRCVYVCMTWLSDCQFHGSCPSSDVHTAQHRSRLWHHDTRAESPDHLNTYLLAHVKDYKSNKLCSRPP